MHSLRNFAIVFVIALLVFGICGYFVTGLVTDSLQSSISGNHKNPVNTDVTAETGDMVVSTVPEDLKGTSFTVLVIGTDYRPSLLADWYHPKVASQYPQFNNTASLLGEGDLPEYPYRTVNADAVLLLSVNKEKKTVTYVSIPSNAILDIRGTETTVANLYYDRGLDYFKDKISAITGVPIDYYAVIGIEDIGNIVTALGGVNYTVPCDMTYTDEISGLSFSLSAGTQNISGEDAMALLSYKNYTLPSLSRTQTTVDFIKALAQKMTGATNLPRAAELYKQVKKSVYTNFTAEDLTANLDLIFAYNAFSIQSISYPVSGTLYRNGETYVIPDITSAVRKISTAV